MYVLCKDCARHVREDDVACPFCRGRRRKSIARPATALVAIGAAAFVACGREEPRAMYGGPPIFGDGSTTVIVTPPDDAGRD